MRDKLAAAQGGGDAEVPEDRLQLNAGDLLRLRRLDPGAGDLDRLGQALALVVGLGVAEILLGVAQVLPGLLERDLLERLGALGQHGAAAAR